MTKRTPVHTPKSDTRHVATVLLLEVLSVVAAVALTWLAWRTWTAAATEDRPSADIVTPTRDALESTR
jgi:threonine/homoserine/homoserine lactone efflux protein